MQQPLYTRYPLWQPSMNYAMSLFGSRALVFRHCNRWREIFPQLFAHIYFTYHTQFLYICIWQDKEPRGIIPLESLSVRECAEEQSRAHCFELFGLNAEVIKACKTDKKTGKVMEGRHSVYKMSAATGDDMADWIKSIKWVSMFVIGLWGVYR